MRLTFFSNILFKSIYHFTTTTTNNNNNNGEHLYSAFPHNRAQSALTLTFDYFSASYIETTTRTLTTLKGKIKPSCLLSAQGLAFLTISFTVGFKYPNSPG